MLSIHLRAEAQNGGHTTVGVFIGRNPESRGKSGQIIVRNDEWLDITGGPLADNEHRALDLPVQVSNQVDFFQKFHRNDTAREPETSSDS